VNRTSLLVLAVLALPVAARPQAAPASPVSDALRQSLARSLKNMTAAAEAMPAEKYSYRPTAPQMTYGHLVMHIAESNFRFCSAISGVPAPEQPKLAETDGKEKLVAAVRSSFDFCSTSLSKLDDTHLGDSIELFGGHSFSRAASILILAGSWSDHYSAQSIYLRLNNLLPPTAQPQK
jgi:DinB superfamily